MQLDNIVEIVSPDSRRMDLVKEKATAKLFEQNEKIYVQVTQEIRSETTEKREYDRLIGIHDNYPKYVLRADEFAGGNYEGIKTMHIADFLLSLEY